MPKGTNQRVSFSILNSSFRCRILLNAFQTRGLMGTGFVYMMYIDINMTARDNGRSQPGAVGPGKNRPSVGFIVFLMGERASWRGEKPNQG